MTSKSVSMRCSEVKSEGFRLRSEPLDNEAGRINIQPLPGRR